MILVDSSVWVDYFKSGKNSNKLDYLIDENILVINDLILSELIPFLKIKRQKKVINLLNSINRLELTINWDQIVNYQYKCLSTGINGVGIPDFIIAQNAIQNNCAVYSLDKHFKMIEKVINLKLLIAD
ncbi:MAG: PIN domain-containing protein [Desulfobacteraceae bacterium]|nr:PIN domain-containing protein [Desulfobacteraceae bacterium]